jgi:hypothetical protein
MLILSHNLLQINKSNDEIIYLAIMEEKADLITNVCLCCCNAPPITLYENGTWADSVKCPLIKDLVDDKTVSIAYAIRRTPSEYIEKHDTYLINRLDLTQLNDPYESRNHNILRPDVVYQLHDSFKYHDPISYFTYGKYLTGIPFYHYRQIKFNFFIFRLQYPILSTVIRMTIGLLLGRVLGCAIIYIIETIISLPSFPHKKDNEKIFQL